MNELVSIMMPAKNAGKYISAAIDSIINQTYTNWELLIVDDKSRDNTREIAELYAKKDGRIKVLNGEGICSGNARNLAIDNSKGSYIMNMDADDISLPDRVTRLMDAARKNPSSIVGSNVAYIDQKCTIKKVSNLPVTDEKIHAGFKRAFNRLTIVPGTILASAHLLKKYRYNEFYKILVDWDLILRMGEDPEIIFQNIKDPLYQYRLNENSMTFSYIPRIKFNLLVRYNEKQRKIKKPEFKSLEALEEHIKNSPFRYIHYRLFFLMKQVQHILWIIRHYSFRSENEKTGHYFLK